jgi:hypothetical protein
MVTSTRRHSEPGAVRVMPFSLTNSPATFPAYLDDSLRPSNDDSAACYLDDIFIYGAMRRCTKSMYVSAGTATSVWPVLQS